MAVNIAINGFGRIGRLVARKLLTRSDVNLVAVNDLGDIKAGAHLFKYDSIHGTFQGDVAVENDEIVVGGRRIKYLSQKDPASLPWGDLGAQIVVESTGVFRSKEKAALHLQGGASKVIITAPAKGKVDLTMVMGVNHEQYTPDMSVVSNASCTTNCLAPMAKVILEQFGIVYGMMNTVHSYTNDQRVLDLDHEDLRRARAAALSLIPTTTGAATAVGEVIPELKGKLDGLAIRVPTPNVSLCDFTFQSEKPVSAEALNQAFKTASAGALQGILKYTELPLVSSDYNGEENSCVVDGLLTMVMGDRMAKVIGWYDNEWGYSARVADMVSYIGARL